MTGSGTILLHDNLSSARTSLLFSAPLEVLQAFTRDEAVAALGRLNHFRNEGFWLAGYFAYELGYLFEERLLTRLDAVSSTPLLYFGVYDAPQNLTPDAVDQFLAQADEGRAEGLTPRQNVQSYACGFARVKDYIAAGDTYQVNLTLKADFKLWGDSLGLYRALAQSQPTAYGAYIDAGDHKILSRSPELFVSGTGDHLMTRPMKGTLKRAQRAEEDERDRVLLQADEKNRAENLMIVDLLRNDLSRVAEPGTVEVTDLFTVETYRTLHTMTSGIIARKRSGIDFEEIIRNLFPCGSITGAPKLRAMEIIYEVEPGPRGIYTGSIGFVAPNGDFAFNVAIRTAVIDGQGNGSIGVGGGIVADSVAEDEYQEALLKLQFLADPAPAVTLIETFKWTPEDGYSLRQRHIERLLASARYFAIEVDSADVKKILDEKAQAWNDPMRVRLTLSGDGLDLTAVVLPPIPDAFSFDIADERLSSASVWVAHKTTNRAFYDEPKKRAHDERGLDELVFLNERGELTEGSFTNLFIERNGSLFTPSLSSGLLAGTLRAELLANGTAQEAVLSLADLHAADAIYLGNSVRGLIRAKWVKAENDA